MATEDILFVLEGGLGGLGGKSLVQKQCLFWAAWAERLSISRVKNIFFVKISKQAS